MRVLISGICGHMGQQVCRLVKEGYAGAVPAGGVDACAGEDQAVQAAKSFEDAKTDVDVIVDFSHHSATVDLTSFAVKNNIPLVIATTGQTEEELASIREASEKIPVFFASNYSMGVALLIDLAKKAASVMKDAEIEIVETHHDRKVDAPSGTALTIAQELSKVRGDAPITTGRTGMGKRTKEEIGIQAVRRGNIVGIHEVMLSTNNQTITLKHEAFDRALFAEGALDAAAFICGKEPGLYDMNSLL